MELKARFDVTYMEEAIVFLASLPEKVQDKIAFNISKSRYFMDKELFKKLNDNIWKFGTRYESCFLHSWILQEDTEDSSQ